MADTGGYVQKIEVIRETASAPPNLTIGERRWTHGTGVLVTALASARTSGPLHHFKEGAPVPTGAVVLMPPPPAGAPVGSRAVVVPAGRQPCLCRVAAGDEQLLRPPRAVSAGTRLGGVNAASRAARVTLARGHAAAHCRGTLVTLEATLTGTSSFTWNAMARLTGADAAQRAGVLGAHLDHVGPWTAAGDDKISTAPTMTHPARWRSWNWRPPSRRPKRTIVFGLFGSEEAGGFGAGYFVDKPVVAHEAMVAQIQFEMVGRADSLVPADHLWLTGYERSNLGAELAKRGARLVQDPRPDQSFFTRSDNIRFARKGIVAHTVSSFNLHKDYHQAGDEVSKIDLAHMTRSIQSMLDPIRWLANSTFKPEWAPGGRPQ
jgi:hypothetical protein